MPTNESDAKRYRRLARECVAMLPIVSRPEARATLIEMTHVWQRLADETKELDRLS